MEPHAYFFCCRDVGFLWRAPWNSYKVWSPGQEGFLCFGDGGGGQINNSFVDVVVAAVVMMVVMDRVGAVDVVVMVSVVDVEMSKMLLFGCISITDIH